MKKVISVLLSVVMLLTVTTGLDLTTFASDLYEIHISGTYDYNRAEKVLELVNEERTAAGLSELTMDTELLDAAMLRACECAVNFDHTRPDGTTYSTLCYKIKGENIEAGRYYTLTTAKSAMESWMESYTHRSNILSSSYKSIGIGCYYNNDVFYWVQCFSTEEAESVPDKTGYVTTTTAVTVKSDIIRLYADFSFDLTTTGETEKLWCGIVNYGWDTVFTLGSSEDYTFASSDENIVQVDSKGYCTAVNEGTATVTVYLKANTDIYYSKKVTIENEKESSSDTTTSKAKPKKTSIKKATSPKKKQIKVTWKKKSGVTGYQIQYATNKKFTKNKKTVTVKGAKNTSKTIKKLKSKKTYYVRVRTYKTVNGKKVYSSWSTVKKVKTK